MLLLNLILVDGFESVSWAQFLLQLADHVEFDVLEGLLERDPLLLDPLNADHLPVLLELAQFVHAG